MDLGDKMDEIRWIVGDVNARKDKGISGDFVGGGVCASTTFFAVDTSGVSGASDISGVSGISGRELFSPFADFIPESESVLDRSGFCFSNLFVFVCRLCNADALDFFVSLTIGKNERLFLWLREKF